jgi:hypothetical protein
MMIAAAAMAVGAPVAVTAAAHGHEAVPAPTEVKVVPSKRQQQRWAGVSPDYRAKGPQAKRRKRSNRLHVSKRTRRAHRRASKGK